MPSWYPHRLRKKECPTWGGNWLVEWCFTCLGYDEVPGFQTLKKHQISFYSKWLALQRLFLWCLFYCCTYYGDVHAKLLFVAACLFCKALPFTRTLMAGSNHQVIAQHVLLQNKTTICIGDSIGCHFGSNSTRFQKTCLGSDCAFPKKSWGTWLLRSSAAKAIQALQGDCSHKSTPDGIL